MSVRELAVLGTASQVPTRDRAHNGLLLRWDGHGVLVDPGEGTQRQLTLAGLPATAITRICLTHDHGDHCFGLPGILQRLALDGVPGPIDVHFPAAAEPVVRSLVGAAVHAADRVRLVPVPGPGPVVTTGDLHVEAARLEHSVETLGWRFREPDGWRLLPERLADRGVEGPARAELQRAGRVRVGGRTVTREEVAVPRPGQRAAVIMDTGVCDGARELAADVDLLVVEATFLESERALAEDVGHLTAAQAARLGAEAGARRVVLTHFSQRYRELDGHVAEARAAAPDLDLVVARDLDRVPVPPRR